MRNLFACSLAILFYAVPAKADVIFESAQLGPSSGSGWSVSPDSFIGVRFQVSAPATVGSVGGHFGASRSPGSVFGAIIALTGATDLPDSEDLSTPDVLAAVLFEPPNPSTDVSAPLVLDLEPGWYGLVFGGGLFGATAGAVAPGLDLEIGEPAYFFRSTGSDGHWAEGGFSDTRLFVTAIPEPGSALLVSAGLLALAGYDTRRRATRRRRSRSAAAARSVRSSAHGEIPDGV